MANIGSQTKRRHGPKRIVPFPARPGARPYPERKPIEPKVPGTRDKPPQNRRPAPFGNPSLRKRKWPRGA